jgi:hypothetical protein
MITAVTVRLIDAVPIARPKMRSYSILRPSSLREAARSLAEAAFRTAWERRLS